MSLYSSALKIPMTLLAPFEMLHILRGWLRYEIGLHEVYRPRPDDIFIATFPKSGTTLMQMMLYQLTTDGSMDFPHILAVSPWFEMEILRGRSGWELFESLPSPRFFKTHLPAKNLPKNGKFIYIARDVRDVAVSSYHHQLLATGMDQDQERFVNQFLRDPVSVRSWFKNIESWWPRRNDQNVLFLTYEGILRDLEGTVRKVAAFCGIDVDESRIPQILERCSLGFMKQHWEKFDPRLRRISRSKAEFIRKGIAGAGRQELTSEQEALVSRRLQELAAKLGCVQGEPYSELFS